MASYVDGSAVDDDDDAGAGANDVGKALTGGGALVEPEDVQNEDDNDFIAPEDEGAPAADDDEDEQDAVTRKRQHNAGTVEEGLDDDDYANHDVTLSQAGQGLQGKRRRLQKAGAVNAEKAREAAALTEEALGRQLFGDDEEVAAPPEEAPAAAVQREADGSDVDEEEDEFGDFIVHDHDERGEPVVRERRPRKKNAMARAAGVSASALQEAYDIFGDGAREFMELQSMRGAAAAAAAEEEYQEADATAAGEEGADEADDGRRARAALRQGARKSEAVRSAVLRQYEPALISQHYLHDSDEAIRAADVPERTQLDSLASRRPAHSLGHRDAAQWIWEQAFSPTAKPTFERWLLQYGAPAVLADGATAPSPMGEGDPIVAAVEQVLRMMHDENLDVPFIAMHRKERIQALLPLLKEDKPAVLSDDDRRKGKCPTRLVRRWDVLWAVVDWDRRWHALQVRKEALSSAMTAAAEQPQGDAPDGFYEACAEKLAAANSAEAVGDVEAFFRLQAPDEVGAMHAARRAHSRSRYLKYRAAALGLLSKELGLSAAQFGENLAKNYKANEPEDGARPPGETAAEISSALSGEYGDAEAVLRSARHMLASELAVEPSVRTALRELYSRHACISTTPTVAGLDVLDPFHPCGSVKRLKDKPLSKLHSGQFLCVRKASQDGLLTYVFGVPDEVEEKLLKDLGILFLSDGVSTTAMAWNQQRELVLKDAICTMLFPAFKKELEKQIELEAISFVTRKIGESFWNLISRAPFKPKMGTFKANGVENCVDEPRIMACCWGPGSTPKEPGVPTTFVMLDAHGELVDMLHCNSIGKRSKMASVLAQRDAEKRQLQAFMGEHSPHVCVVGAASLACKDVREAVFEVIRSIVEENPRAIPVETENIEVVYNDEMIARLFESSRFSSEVLKDQPTHIRRTVALGRCLLDPLAVIAALCGPAQEILSLPLHPLQVLIPAREHSKTLERLMVTAVNQVGLDVNSLMAHEWQRPALQFIAGLGPRKAGALIDKIKQLDDGRLDNRWQLRDLVGPLVTTNAASALRVRHSGDDEESEEHLDVTRIQPETYNIAREMVCNALDIEVNGPEDDDSRKRGMQIYFEKALENWKQLEELDLEEYEAELRRRLGESRLHTVHDIKAELRDPFGEVRRPYTQPTAEEEFYMLSGESEQSLKKGKLLAVVVRRISRDKVICELESGLEGSIEGVELSDRWTAETRLDDRVAVGQLVHARVVEVNHRQYSVVLSSKNTNFTPAMAEYFERFYFGADEHYSCDNGRSVPQKPKIARKLGYVARTIDHPLFQNVSLLEAQTFLENKPVGDIVIRPSSKGPTHLSLTLKFYEGVTTNVDIKEGGKGNSQVANLRLGRPLTIQISAAHEDTFEDLDEVMARYVEPLVANIRAIMEHRKFSPNQKEVVDASMAEQRRVAPTTFAWQFAPDFDNAGYFLLAFMTRSRPQHERIHVLPNGFHFRSKVFSRLDKLEAWFKADEARKSKEHAASQARALQNVRPGPAAPPVQAPPWATRHPQAYMPQAAHR